mmetsp:Transcript_12196/g.36221  ORF Transcript_12196/g.36221 Transcript_12196/m.36221 type:complete len:326 (+) Transcript_12196:587-1564(+)
MQSTPIHVSGRERDWDDIDALLTHGLDQGALARFDEGARRACAQDVEMNSTGCGVMRRGTRVALRRLYEFPIVLPEELHHAHGGPLLLAPEQRVLVGCGHFCVQVGERDGAPQILAGLLARELELVDADPVPREGPADPVAARVVGRVRRLHEEVLAEAENVRSVEEYLAVVDRLQLRIQIEAAVAHDRLGCARPPHCRIALVIRHQGVPPRVMLEVPALPGHRGLDDIVARDEEYVARASGAARLGDGEDRRLDLRAEVDNVWAGHLNALALQDICEVFHQLGCPPHWIVDHLGQVVLENLAVVLLSLHARLVRIRRLLPLHRP